MFEHGREYDLHFFQPSMFWTRQVGERSGGLDERYHYAMDMEWCLRALALGVEVGMTEDVLSRYTLHPTAKSVAWRHRQLAEEALMYRRLGQRPDFRRRECLMASARPQHRALNARARYEMQEGLYVRSALHRSLGAGVGLLRRVVPGLARPGRSLTSSAEVVHE